MTDGNDDKDLAAYLPADPVQRKVLTDCIDVIVGSKARQQAERTIQFEAAKAKAKECGVKAAKIRSLAAWKFRGATAIAKKVEQLSTEEAELEILYGPNIDITKAPVAP